MTDRAVALIVDTNVLVGGLLMTDPTDPSARIVAAMQDGQGAFVVSEALTAEYREVLLRPKLMRRHGRAADAVDGWLDRLAGRATVLAPAAGPRAPDPGDQMLWDLLAARADLRLVTADRALLRDRGMAGHVVTAAYICGVAHHLAP